MNPSDTGKLVAVYARVSTEHEAQLQALDYQVEWYKKVLQQHPEWKLVEIYVDQGITGTAAKKRPQFMKMIEDAKRRRFDMIITREVSRFARNTVDTLQYTRMLKEKGVEVYFINDNIRTFEGDGELRLTIMATLAQEESRKMSIRVKAGQKTAMEKGVLFGNGNILGYERVGRDLVINPEQAETVRMIFDMYLAGMTYQEIASEMERLHRLTATGKENWHTGTIKQTLSNSFYCGIITYRKEYVPDYLKQVKIVNFGDVPKITVQGTHMPIVTAEEYETVQKIRASRRIDGDAETECKHSMGTVKRPVTVWTALLQCECGGKMYHRKWAKYQDITVWGYECVSHSAERKSKADKDDSSARKCENRFIAERMLYTMANVIFASYFQYPENREEFASLALEKEVKLKQFFVDPDKIKELEKSISDLEGEYGQLVRDLQENRITPGAFTTRNSELQGKKSIYETDLMELKEKLVEDNTATNPAEMEKVCKELKTLYERFEGTDVDNHSLFRFVERIVAHDGTYDWYLCLNNNPYLYYRNQYSDKRFRALSRKLIHTETITRPDVFQFFHPTNQEPNYRWKDLTINIWV